MLGLNTPVLSPREIKNTDSSCFCSRACCTVDDHIIHSKLLHVKECFVVGASRIFDPETTSLIEELGNKILQAEVKQTLHRTASLSMDKLQEQMSTDPCRKTFAMVDNLFNPSGVVLNDVNSNLVTLFQTLQGMKHTNLTSADIAHSYTRFKEIVKAEAEKKHLM
ncbi:hypothetical protein PR048_010301 [Dryococelus australis]|uniref:Uncharacterized protein n=1 Tax=Dryococelus australis TaxID=614101 RepID=A0ABQ9I2B3_9NEOP|nr:hypothetical protein PR048_010301 [Dryococelus australis]